MWAVRVAVCGIGEAGFEPAAPGSQSQCSAGLSYSPSCYFTTTYSVTKNADTGTVYVTVYVGAPHRTCRSSFRSRTAMSTPTSSAC